MQQIADWLQKLGLGQYAQRFAENDINFAILPHLTDQDLKELGVASLGHRRQLLLAIAETSGVQKGTAPPPSATEAPIALHDTAERRQVTPQPPPVPHKRPPTANRTRTAGGGL